MPSIRWTLARKTAGAIAALWVLICAGSMVLPIVGQTVPQQLPPTAPARLGKPQDKPAPQAVQPLPKAAAAPQLPPQPGGEVPFLDEARVLPIDLGTALRLAATNNLDIANAREVVNLAQLQFDRARILILPNMNLGSTYLGHEGRLQKTEGNVITANKDALFVGGGPTITLSLAEAIFAPLVARQNSAASQANFRRVHNDTLLAVAEAYFTVLRARRKLARVDVVLEYLTSDQASPIRGGSKGLLPVVDAINKAGAAEALKSEVYRVQVEVIRRQEERVAALQEFRVAVAELARLLRLPPDVPLWPLEDFRVPLDLSGPFYDMPLEDQVGLALNNRPEIAENRALVQAAVERVKLARWRPWVPNFVATYSWGEFGGGPDPNAPKVSGGKVVNQPGFGPSGQLHHFGTRDDYDLSLVWRFQNFGLGNLAEVREQETVFRQFNYRQLALQDQVVTQVIQVNELIKGWGQRSATARSALFDPAGKPTGPVFEAIRLNFLRIREVEKTRPLEVIDSIRGLSDLLESYSQDMTDYDRARFRLMIVMGLTPEEIISRIAVPPPAPMPPPK